MKVLSVIRSMDDQYGGPPAVLKNQISVINNEDKKIVSVLKSNNLSKLQDQLVRVFRY